MDQPRYVEEKAPPSSYAIADVLEGTPGAWLRVAGLTAIRAAVIYPGLRLSGIKGGKAIGGSVLGSLAVTGYMLAYYGFARGELQRRTA